MTKLLISLFIKDKDNIINAKVRQSYGMLGGAVGIGCNVLLFIAKFFAGLITGAISITADAFNNLSDAGSSIVTLIGFKMAGKPADRDHPFGHGRIEYISGLFVAMVIMLMGIELIKSSIDKILNPQAITFNMLSIGILLVSILIKLWMAMFNKKIGNIIGSATMKATAMDSLSDCIATTGVLVGMGISYITGLHIDGYVGIIVAIFILFAGFNAAKDTLQPLLGQAPDPEFVKEIEDTVMQHEEIMGIHDMVIHDYGPSSLMISLHAEIPYDMDILEAHEVIDIIEYELKNKFHCEVTIHMDPIVTDDELTNTLRSQISQIVGSIDERLSIHDFRLIKGYLHTNLIFDVLAPFNIGISDKDIMEQVTSEIKKLDKTYYTVITIDKA